MSLEVGRMAQAAGIKITGGGLKQFGEPLYYYKLEFYLQPGYQFLPKDSVTLEMLAGVNVNSPTSAPGGSPSGPWITILTFEGTGSIPNYSPPTNVPFADVTFLNASNIVQDPTGDPQLFLGQFVALTAVSLPLLPLTYFVDIDWTATLHTLDGTIEHDSGVVRLGIITIPEPASVILLSAGIGLPIILKLRRWYQPSVA